MAEQQPVQLLLLCAMLYTQSAVMPQYVVCLSVCPSVTFRCCDHIAWNTSKIISRLISLRFLLGLTHWLTPTWAVCSNGNTPKLGWNRGGAMCKKPAISLKRCNVGPRRIHRTSHTYFRSFDSYQNRCPWMTLNGGNAPLRKKVE